jgi:hypothetical protein
MKNITTSILSWLLHHANRKYNSPEFYTIKNRLLKKYGTHICYDVQFIEGKKCHTCGGTGIYSKYYDSYGFVSDVNYCWHCDGTGWYKLPVWNILARLQFGKYTFHQPFQRSYTKPDNNIPVIDGYIEHENSKHSDFAATMLFLIYEKSYLKRWWKSAGSWYCKWYWPRNWMSSIIHILKYRLRSYPAIILKRKIKKLFERSEKPCFTNLCDLPF